MSRVRYIANNDVHMKVLNGAPCELTWSASCADAVIVKRIVPSHPRKRGPKVVKRASGQVKHVGYMWSRYEQEMNTRPAIRVAIRRDAPPPGTMYYALLRLSLKVRLAKEANSLTF
jgi:hypothetical protein